MTLLRAHDLKLDKESINEDLLECYNLLNKKNLTIEDIDCIIRRHRRFINSTSIYGKNKYSTLNLLIHFRNTEDKSLAMGTLTSSLNKKGIFSISKE